jgi:phosphatidate cytidylyltransferase
MLRWRILLGAVFIAALVALCWLDAHASIPGIWLLPLAIMVGVLASGELLRLFAARGMTPLTWTVYLGNTLVIVSNWIPYAWGGAADASAGALGPLAWPAAALAVTVLLVFSGEMLHYTVPHGITERLALALFAVVYVGFSLSFVVALRFLGPPGGPAGAWGLPALASLILVVKLGDTGAYTVGRLVGRHKMAPLLSPGKTIEGAIGGLAFSCLGAWLALKWLLPAMTGAAPSEGTSSAGPWWGWIVYGLLVGAAGMLGDLAESLLKRDAGRKDSSDWMPGFGGVLDVIDSLLLAAPVAWLCWALKVAGP